MIKDNVYVVEIINTNSGISYLYRIYKRVEDADSCADACRVSIEHRRTMEKVRVTPYGVHE